jgi:molecular chaperone DnaJ
MITRDYYLVLGVSRTAQPNEIRQAFRQRALERHPDHVGSGSTRDFQDLSDAYHVLFNPERRAAYDAELRRDEAMSRGPVTDLRSRRAPVVGVEPLARSGWPSSLFHDFRAAHDVVEETFGQLLRSFTGWGERKSDQVQAIDVEVLLDPSEALDGAVLAIGVPASTVCPACDGTGIDGWYPCRLCGQSGLLEREIPVQVPVPPWLNDGTVIETSLARYGGRRTVLRTRIRLVG